MPLKPTYKELEKRVQELEQSALQNKSVEIVSEGKKSYQSFFKNIHTIMLIIDPENGDIVDANPAAVSFYGWPYKELITKNISDINFLKKDQLLREMQQAAKGKQCLFQFQHRLASGRIIDVEAYSGPVSAYGKNLLYSIIHDISDRKKTENALALSKQKLDLHVLQTPLAVIEWDLAFRVRSCNPAAEKIFGYTQEELIGKHASEIVFGEDKTQVGHIWENLLKQKGGTHSTNKNITKDGKILFCEWFNTPIINEIGETIAVFSLAQDITRRWHAEETVQFERDKLRSVINGIGDSLYIVNRDYIIEFQNNIFKEQFGDLTGKKCYKNIFQQKEPCDFCLMQETLSGNCSHQIEADTQNKKSYDIIFSPLQETEAKMKSVVVFRDVTEKKALQAEALRAGHLASLGELAAGVAHEINNPVTGIITIAEILADKFQELGGDKKIPERIIREGERISKIVKNLLSFARDLKEEHMPASIKDVLKLSLELIEKQILNDGIQLYVHNYSDIPMIRMNSQEIQQVFLNILSNARYAIKKKYPKPHENKIIEIKTQVIKVKSTEYLRITFFDSGTGIPDNILEKITDPFFSTKPPGEGTGLGLSISHGIIKNHNGRLSFDSRKDEYTNVMIDLPVYGDSSLKE